MANVALKCVWAIFMVQFKYFSVVEAAALQNSIQSTTSATNVGTGSICIYLFWQPCILNTF